MKTDHEVVGVPPGGDERARRLRTATAANVHEYTETTKLGDFKWENYVCVTETSVRQSRVLRIPALLSSLWIQTASHHQRHAWNTGPATLNKGIYQDRGNHPPVKPSGCSRLKQKSPAGDKATETRSGPWGPCHPYDQEATSQN